MRLTSRFTTSFFILVLVTLVCTRASDARDYPEFTTFSAVFDPATGRTNINAIYNRYCNQLSITPQMDVGYCECSNCTSCAAGYHAIDSVESFAYAGTHDALCKFNNQTITYVARGRSLDSACFTSYANAYQPVYISFNNSDNDNYNSCNDCNDSDATIYPGAPELCDGEDNDCDGTVDEGCPIDPKPDGDNGKPDCPEGG